LKVKSSQENYMKVNEFPSNAQRGENLRQRLARGSAAVTSFCWRLTRAQLSSLRTAVVIWSTLSFVIAARAALTFEETLPFGFELMREGPTSALIRCSDGALYGTVQWAGTLNEDGFNDVGGIYRVDPDGSNYQAIYAFKYGDSEQTGGNPVGALLEGSDGALYGTTIDGGPFGLGVLFKVNKDGTGFAVLHAFAGTDGAFPKGDLIKGSDGLLYGTAQGGKSADTTFFGSIFRIPEDGAGFSVLHQFSREEGGFPCAKLLEGDDGFLYGTASKTVSPAYSRTLDADTDRATVFKIDKNGVGFAVLHTFEYASQGSTFANPGEYFYIEPGKGYFCLPSLVRGADGALYGVTGQIVGLLRSTEDQGTVYPGDKGSIFKLNQNGSGFMVLQQFPSEQGYGGGYEIVGPSNPVTLVNSGDGSLYGMTSDGRPGDMSGWGTIFKVNVPFFDSSDVTWLYSLPIPENRLAMLVPETLTEIFSGVFFGTSLFGGPYGEFDSTGFAGLVFKISLDEPPPAIASVSPTTKKAGAAAFLLTIEGRAFRSGATVLWNGSERPTTFVNGSQLTAQIPAADLVGAAEILTVIVSIRNPEGRISNAESFTVTPANVGIIQSNAADPGEAVTVSTAPVVVGQAGVTATVDNSGDIPVGVTVANYSSNPSGAAFSAGGGFTDVQITGATASMKAIANFYYPSTLDPATEAALNLVYFNGSAWVSVRGDAGTAPVKNTTDNLDATISGGRFTVTFSDTSTPKITELHGTFFAVGMPLPISFNGFLSPIGGADAAGGNSGNPLRTFKMGSTIPVKFTAALNGSPVIAGIHRLQAVKYSSATTSGTPIDATPQGSATTGNQFRFSDGQWQFNLDTKGTGLSVGVWQLIATLSDASTHNVWIQLK
jgi:uncharacterized repeat protein (TIGR03803 family)